MKYKIFIRMALSGLIILEKEFESHNKFYEYVGSLYMNSLEKIERIDYKILRG